MKYPSLVLNIVYAFPMIAGTMLMLFAVGWIFWATVGNVKFSQREQDWVSDEFPDEVRDARQIRHHGFFEFGFSATRLTFDPDAADSILRNVYIVQDTANPRSRRIFARIAKAFGDSPDTMADSSRFSCIHHTPFAFFYAKQSDSPVFYFATVSSEGWNDDDD